MPTVKCGILYTGFYGKASLMCISKKHCESCYLSFMVCSSHLVLLNTTQFIYQNRAGPVPQGTNQAIWNLPSENISKNLKNIPDKSIYTYKYIHCCHNQLQLFVPLFLKYSGQFFFPHIMYSKLGKWEDTGNSFTEQYVIFLFHRTYVAHQQTQEMYSIWEFI